jgi:hypothetical protein
VGGCNHSVRAVALPAAKAVFQEEWSPGTSQFAIFHDNDPIAKDVRLPANSHVSHGSNREVITTQKDTGHSLMGLQAYFVHVMRC